MNLVQTKRYYPGSHAEIEEIIDLAEAYYEAAKVLFQNGSKGDSISYAPARLCSIHAIELFLNAFLRYEGRSSEQIRGRLHNLADEAFTTKLRLRKKTADHLTAMTEKREYLISRYAPELAFQHTELNRLTATLEEIRSKMIMYLKLPNQQKVCDA